MALRDRFHRFVSPSGYDSGIVAQAPTVAAAEIARRFWPYARPYRKQIALGLLLLAIVPAIDTVEIFLFKLVVDDVLVPQDLQALWPLAAAYLGLAVANALAGFADEYVATWVGERFLLDIRTKLFAHIQTLSPDQLGRRRVGDLLSRLTGDVAAIERFLLSALGEGFSAIVRILFFAGALFVLSWKLALAALVVAPLFLVVSRSFARLVKRTAREKRRRSGTLSSVAEESLNASALVQSLNRQDEEVARFRTESAAIMDAELAATRISGLYTPLIGLIELLGGMLVIGFGVVALQSGDLTLGGLLIFFTYLAQLYSPIRSLGSLSNDVFAAAAGAERVLELLNQEPTIRDRPDARPLRAPVAGELAVDGVSYTHPGAEGPALTDVSFRAAPGEIVALVGPSGAGKSTLARLLMRFADPQSGAIRLDGTDLREVTVHSLRDHVGLLLQDTLLPDASARVAIAQGRAGATDAEVVEAARAAGILDVLRALPDGLDTPIGPGGSRLSGGQRRRLAIARAFLRDTEVLILDEPTTGLDEVARDQLLPALQALADRRTTIVITHDPVVAAWADRVLDLRAGALV